MMIPRNRLLALVAGFAVVCSASTLWAQSPAQTPAGGAQAQPVSVSVNWNELGRELAREAFSLNAFQGFNPAVVENPAYQANIAYMNPGMLRYHNHSGMMSDAAKNPAAWLNWETRSWDVEKIRRVTAAWPKGRKVMLNIPSWPEWMADENKFLRPEFVEDYARLCADLVRIINIELGLGVELWEPLNERELLYVRDQHRAGKESRFEEIMPIYNACAKAMKAVDPTIKVGGPSFSSIGWWDQVHAFVPATLENLDYFTCHVYVSDDKSISDERVYNSAMGFGPRVAKLRAYLDEVSGGRHIPISVNEYNISWTYKSGEPRMTNYKGAVFDAIAMVALLTNGADSTFAWNDIDGIYGKMSRSYELRPGANLYHVLNGHFIGKVAQTSSANTKAIIPFAVVATEGGAPALMLVNRSEQPQTASVDFAGSGWKGGERLTVHQIDQEGYSRQPLAWDSAPSAQYTLPAFSVMLITPESDVNPPVTAAN